MSEGTPVEKLERGRDLPGGRVDRKPLEHRSPHSLKPPMPLSDAQTEEEFLRSFSSPTESIVHEPQVVKPQVDETRRVTVPKSPNSYVLPKGVVFYDDDGAEVEILERRTHVDGEWEPRPPKESGPARFRVSRLYPNGLERPGVEVRGLTLKRRGKLWYGQTSSDIKKKPR